MKLLRKIVGWIVYRDKYAYPIWWAEIEWLLK
jgi:hypothetical protein